MTYVQAAPGVAPLTERDPGYEGWRVVAASSVGVFVGFASLFIYTFGIFLKPLTAEFGWSREAYSAGFGCAAMTVAICSPGLGYLFDRVGPRRIILPCLVVFGCAFASMAWLTPSVWHFYAVCVALGAVGNGTAQMAYSRAVTSWFDRHRGLALALMMCGGAVGAIVMPPLAQSLIAAFGWRQAAAVLGLGVVGIGVPTVARFIREQPRRASRAAQHAGATVAHSLRSRGFWILVTVLFFSSIGQNGAIAHLAALLTDRGVTPGGAALAVSAMGVASVAGRLVTGWLLDRFFAARVSFVLLALAALGILMLSDARSVAVGVVAAGLIGFGMGGEADVIPYMLSRYYGLRAFATLYGLTWTAYACAGAIGPILMGKAFDSTGSYETLLVWLAGGMLGVALLMWFAPRYD